MSNDDAPSITSIIGDHPLGPDETRKVRLLAIHHNKLVELSLHATSLTELAKDEVELTELARTWAYIKAIREATRWISSALKATGAGAMLFFAFRAFAGPEAQQALDDLINSVFGL